MPNISPDENPVLVTPSKLAFFDMEDIFKFYLENRDGILTRTVYPFYEDSSKLHNFCLENNIRYIIIPYIEPVHYDKTHYTDQDMQKLSSTISFIESSGLFKKEYSASSGYNHLFVYSLI